MYNTISAIIDSKFVELIIILFNRSMALRPLINM